MRKLTSSSASSSSERLSPSPLFIKAYPGQPPFRLDRHTTLPSASLPPLTPHLSTWPSCYVYSQPLHHTTLSVGSISGFDFSTVKTSLTDDTEKNAGLTSDHSAVHDFSVLIGSFILPPDDMIQMSEPVPLFGLDFTKAQPDEVDMYGCAAFYCLR